MNNQKSLIIGMGKTGNSFAEYLSAKNMPFDFADTRECPPDVDEFKAKYQGKRFYLGQFNTEVLDQYQQILLSPGFDIRHPLVQQAEKKNIAIKSDIDLFISEVDAKIIGITGSNGKSTLTALMGYTLNEMGYKSDIGGNIGIPVLSLLNKERQDIYVLELSSFQLDISDSLDLDVAVVLNITEDHMDRYDSFSDYISSKLSIYKNTKNNVVNIDDESCAKMRSNENVITFSLYDSNADIYFSEKDNTFYSDENLTIEADKFSLKGLHNYQNILAALAIAKALDINLNDFSKSATAYKGLPHRCELICVVNDIVWINDSKATNVGAALSAINGIKKPLHLIMGGQAKGANFKDFVLNISADIKTIILLGEDSLLMESFLKEKFNTVLVNDIQEAVYLAKNNSTAGDVVLLSPACASFDMYSGYEERGDDFKKHVMAVAA